MNDVDIQDDILRWLLFDDRYSELQNLKIIRFCIQVHPTSSEHVLWQDYFNNSSEPKEEAFFRRTAQRLQESFIPSKAAIKESLDRFTIIQSLQRVDFEARLNPHARVGACHPYPVLVNGVPRSSAPFVDISMILEGEGVDRGSRSRSDTFSDEWIETAIPWIRRFYGGERVETISEVGSAGTDDVGLNDMAFDIGDE